MKPKIVESKTENLQLCEVFASDDFSPSLYPWALRFAGRFPIPDFQRELCWDEGKCVNLIESVYLGLDIGSYMVNSFKSNECGLSIEYSDCIIDGQQRITAISKYINNEFKVWGEYYKDISRSDRMRFKQFTFPCKTFSSFDAEILKTIYNKLNFSGVRHF